MKISSGIVNLLIYAFFFFSYLAALYQSSGQKRSPSVIVIGSGFAGIAAARTLHDASFQVSSCESMKALLFSVVMDNFTL